MKQNGVELQLGREIYRVLEFSAILWQSAPWLENPPSMKLFQPLMTPEAEIISETSPKLVMFSLEILTKARGRRCGP
jgi:hypothetical protein